MYGLDCGVMKPVRVMKKENNYYYLEDMVLTVISERLPGNKMIILGFCLSKTENSDDINVLLRSLEGKYEKFIVIYFYYD